VFFERYLTLEGLWLETESKLLKVCNEHPRHKKREQEILVSSLLDVNFEKLPGGFKGFIEKCKEKIDGRSTVLSIAKKIEDVRKK
jgi:hypothetical protein